MRYHVRRAKACPELEGKWDGPAWAEAETAEVKLFRPDSSDHRPVTRAKLLYDAEAIYGIFHVRDKYVRAVHTEYQGMVCHDSCVEFFVKPKPDRGYFNFEFSCCGAFLLYYITDHTLRPDGEFEEFVELPPEDGGLVRVYHSMPDRVEPEIEQETEWVIEFAVPYGLFEKYVGPIGDPAGREWRANFYKCGDSTSHPHWASWAPLTATNFHLPECFGTLVFER